ncbi:hypothetical protein [Pontibacter ruber]|uniref:DUF748 domain-containing protein n=1 Tax=Pontibacter ruber TaxID=1343895 RepID=A0ABW5CRE2_9BACT|nr:hypothetical protein [Pontibacter ruber]
MNPLTQLEKPFRTRWWFWILLALCLFILAVLVVSVVYLQPWLQQKIETSVKEQTKGLYTLQVKELHTSILTGSITLDSVQLVPNEKLWEQKQKSGQDSLPTTLVTINAKQLHLSGIGIGSLLFKKKPLALRTFKLEKLRVEVRQMRKDTSTRKPLHQLLKGRLEHLRIAQLHVSDGYFIYTQAYKSKYHKLKLEGLHLDVQDIRLDSTSLQNPERAFYAGGFSFSAKKTHTLLPDEQHIVTTGAVEITSQTGEISISNLKYKPRYKPGTLARIKGAATTWLTIDVPHIRLLQVNFPALSRYNNIDIQTITLSQPKLNAFLDRKHFRLKGEKPLPHDLVQELKTGLAIDKVEVKGMSIRYEELAPEASETGYITFENCHATFTNITNDKNRMSAKNPAVLKAEFSIMGKAPVQTTIRLNLLDPQGSHTLNGSIGATDPQILNPILEPTAFVSIKSGTLRKTDFQVRLNRQRATGTLRSRYNGFKIDILSKDEDTRQTFRKKLLSKVANKVAIKSGNPDDGEERVGEVRVARAAHKSLFNYWKDCLVSGFKSLLDVNGVGADLQDPNRM